MRFLVDEDLPLSTGDLLLRYGHEAFDVRRIGLRGAKDPQIAAYAKNQSLCIVTGDFGFSDIRNYPPADYPGLVVLKVPRTATALTILRLLESLLQQQELVERLPGNLAIVESGRVRIRTG